MTYGSRKSGRASEIACNHTSCVDARSPCEAGAGMRSRAAQKKTADRRAVLTEPQERPHGEELIERELAMENLAAGQPPAALEVERRQDLARDDTRLQRGRVLLERRHHGIAQALAGALPVGVPQVIRRKLRVGREDVRSRWGQRSEERRV